MVVRSPNFFDRNVWSHRILLSVFLLQTHRIAVCVTDAQTSSVALDFWAPQLLGTPTSGHPNSWTPQLDAEDGP